MTSSAIMSSPSTQLEDFWQLLAQPEQVAIQLLPQSSANTNNEAVKQLKNVCATLFQQIERLGTMKGQPPISSLDELYLGETDALIVDAETIYAQIELQTNDLHQRLKRHIKLLSKAATYGPTSKNAIRLLEDVDDSDKDDGENESHADVDADNDEDATADTATDAAAAVDDDDDESMIDEESKRARERMERAMEDMEEEENSDTCSNPDTKLQSTENFEGEELEKDRDALNLHDGFFNLQEMEAFADEEEEYLPQDAFGEVTRENEDDDHKRSFHQKQRDGDVENVLDYSEDDENNDTDLIFHKETNLHHRKYRADDEIDALYKLYDDKIDEDDEDVDDVINLTAVDVFGKPSQKFYQRWNSKSKESKKVSEWDDTDFEKDNIKYGWNDDNDNIASDNEVGADPSGDHVESEPDEAIPMNDIKSKPQKQPTKQADKILAETELLEREMLAEKPWQMTGETGSSSRPVNSLLEITPQFDVASKQAPVITIEHTTNIEEFIKRRILAEDWDDVIPRELPDVGWHKKRGELPEVSQEKSKLGLGELYEREYLKKVTGYDKDTTEKESEEGKAKSEMKSLFANLCSKLDALSNYHFAPRPIAEEAEVRTITQPAIAMEEVMPLYVSDARAVAPEEVYGAKRGRDAILRADSELEQADRKRLRASKKAARRKQRKAKLADDKLISRLQPGLGLNNPYEKRKMREELSMARAGGTITTGVADKNDNYGASSTFFKRMQEEAEQSIQQKRDAPETKGDTRSSQKSSALKL